MVHETVSLHRPIFERNGTTAADVYAYGIILHEIFEQKGVFFHGVDIQFSVKDIIMQVRPSLCGLFLHVMVCP